MKHRFAVVALAVLAGACTESADITAPADSLPPQFSEATATPGDVYTMSNAASGNEVLRYSRAADGSLAFVAAYASGGNGSGAGLGNQAGLTPSLNGRLLLAVNAGSNSVSVFTRNGDGSLTLDDTEPSGGTMPISVAQHEDMVYVLNAGGTANISGFKLRTATGDLTPIPNSDRPLSAAAPGPAQIEFNNRGEFLVVTEKGTNRILTYHVDRHTGKAGSPVINDSDGMTPFGFDFDDRGFLVVSNAAGGAAGAGSLSSYFIRDNGTLEVQTGQVANYQGAPCWVVITKNGQYAYTTNTASNSTSGYALGVHAELSLLDASGVTANNTGIPIDAAIDRHGGQHLYVLNSAGAIDAFDINSDGSLTALAGGASGVPTSASGLVAY
jgi:6-phosphogluconolactonase